MIAAAFLIRAAFLSFKLGKEPQRVLIKTTKTRARGVVYYLQKKIGKITIKSAAVASLSDTHLKMTEGVDCLFSDGTSLQTKTADYYPQKSTLSTDSDVTGQSSFGAFRANSFCLEDSGDLLTLRGDITVTSLKKPSGQT